jgi:hypothetical protein
MAMRITVGAVASYRARHVFIGTSSIMLQAISNSHMRSGSLAEHYREIFLTNHTYRYILETDQLVCFCEAAGGHGTVRE